MRLTRYTDYALRVLMYLSARPDHHCAISEISGSYGISHNHLTKVVQDLRRSGFVSAMRGRNGGITLARPAAEINVGAVVRVTEDSFQVVDCNTCIVAPGCGLSSVMGEATNAFVAVLDRYTLADLPHGEADFMMLFPMPEGDRQRSRGVVRHQSNR